MGLVVGFSGRIDQGFDGGEDRFSLRECVLVDCQGRAARGLGLKNAAHRLQVGALGCGAKVDHEAHRRQEQTRLQRGHVRAVALARLKHPHDAQRAHSFPQRATGDAQLTGEILLDRQAGPRAKRPARDHPFDSVNNHIGLGSGGRPFRWIIGAAICSSIHQTIIEAARPDTAASIESDIA